MAQEIGVAYVSLLPSGKGFSAAADKELDGTFKGAEKKSSGFFGKLTKGAVGVVAGAVAAIGAVTAGKGIARALNIEDATAKLKGLGHNAQSVEQIMSSALASVKGTAFGLDTAATVAATAVAAGIKPGQQLEKYLRLTADAATIAGTSMEDMGSILNKTTTSGKVFTEELNQLADRGLPVFQWLQDEYGVTAEELRRMVSAGEVDAATFRKVIEENIGGAALASGETTRGAFANMMAGFGRLGAMFAGPGLGAAREFFGEVTTLLDGVGERVKPFADAFGNMLSGIEFSGMAESILGFFDNLDIGAMISSAMTARGSLLEAGVAIVQQLLEGLITAVPTIVQGAADMLTQVMQMIIEQGPALLMAAVELFSTLIDGVITILPQLIETIVTLVPQIATGLIEMIPQLIEAGIQLFTALVNAIPVIIPMLVTALTDLLPVVVNTLISLIPVVIQGALDLFMAIVNAIPVIVPALINGIFDLLPVIISAVLDLLPALLDGAVQLFTGLVKAIPVVLPALLNALKGLGPKIVDTILQIGPKLLDAGKTLIGKLIEGVKSMFGAIGEAMGGVMDFIGGFFPHSPAKWGPFSGRGWTQIAESGATIVDEFMSGLQSSGPTIQAALNNVISVPSLAGVASTNTMLDGMSITGTLQIGGDGLGHIIDGRIHKASTVRRVSLENGYRA